MRELMAALPTPNSALLTELPINVTECRLLLCILWMFICCPCVGENLSWHTDEEHGQKTSAIPYSCSRVQTWLAYFLPWQSAFYHGIQAGVGVIVVPWAWSHWWDIAIARHVWPPERGFKRMKYVGADLQLLCLCWRGRDGAYVLRANGSELLPAKSFNLRAAQFKAKKGFGSTGSPAQLFWFSAKYSCICWVLLLKYWVIWIFTVLLFSRNPSAFPG